MPIPPPNPADDRAPALNLRSQAAVITRVAAAGRRVRAGARVHAPLLAILVLGIAVHGYLVAVYRPAAGVFLDSITYLETSKNHLFSDEMRMAGYPLLLRIARYAIPDLTLVIVIQHGLVLATGVLLYVSVRRVTGGRWLPAVPAAFVVLSGDYLLLAHSLLTETIFMFLATAALTALIFAIDGNAARYALLATSGLALGSAWAIRTVALPLILFALVWLLVVGGPPLATRLRRAATFAAPALALVGAYIVLQGALAGFWGVLPGSGWMAYMRVAPVADCEEFDPPSGTAFLCEGTPARSRSGPGYYQAVGGPAIARFGSPFHKDARGSDVVGEFGRAVMIGQPLDYLREVGRDAIRFVVPNAGLDRPYAGPPMEELDIARRHPDIEQATSRAAASVGFDDEPISVDSSLHSLADLQGVLRLSGSTLVLFLVLASLGVAVGSGRLRWASALLLGFAVLQPLTAAATISWGYRYGVVGMGQLVAAAAIGVAALIRRYPPSQTRTDYRA